MKRSFLYTAALGLVFIKLVMLSSCANILPPSGGLRDSLPPKLVSAIPKDSALNVTTTAARNIVLTFDEYITTQGVNQSLVVSPNVKTTPIIDSKLRTLTIKMRDSLEANTTYALDFGDAVRDVNEGNIAKNFVYVFSSGSKIDSHTYGGRVIMAETGKIDSTLIVVLHNNLSDTAVFKLRPRYIAKLNGKGEFRFKYLPVGEFRAYVVKTSYLNNYSDSTDPFAFRTQPLITGSNDKSGDTLYAYEALKKTQRPTNTLSASGVKLPGSNKDDKRLRYGANIEGGHQDLLSAMILTFNRRLTRYDSTAIQLYDTNYHKLNGAVVSLDTTQKIITLSYPWKEQTGYRIILPKEALADSAGVTLTKTDTLRFVTKKESEYGSLRLRFTNINMLRNPVLQIVSNDKLVESVPLTSNEFRRKLFHAATYDLRILYDTNKNGQWDPGDFAKRLQPEIVYLIPKQVAVKANWDNEVNIPVN